MHLDILLQDLRYTLRTLARDRGFTARRRTHSRPRHRRQRRRLQRRQHALAPPTALRQCRSSSSGCTAGNQVRPLLRNLFGRRLRSIPQPQPLLSGHHRLLCFLRPRQLETESSAAQPQPRHRRRGRWRISSRCSAFSPQWAAHSLPRKPSKAQPRCAAQPRLLAAPVRADPTIIGKAVTLNESPDHSHRRSSRQLRLRLRLFIPA